ncbi:MAG: hypothetical protein QF752_02185 [Planctomycetota bacterium]|jgi:hypothetical protein|nr:hypothetical protein [Planctomycetota bacterium]
MTTRRILLLVTLLASALSGVVVGDTDYTYDISQWRYGNRNAGNEITTSILAIPGNIAGGTRLATLENSNNGWLLGASQEQQSARVHAFVGRNGQNTLYSKLSIGGTVVSVDHLHSATILPIQLRTSHNSWQTLTPVHQNLWGVVHLRARSALHVSHNATARLLRGDPSVTVNTSVRRYGMFEAFLADGVRKVRIMSRAVELLDGLRTGGITATMTDCVGADAQILERQKVDLTLDWPGILRSTRNLKLLPRPHRMTIARWKFSGVDQLRRYGHRD